ncbi:MAG TPA: hypothetical protein PK969_08215, partial [Treponemataceae bacterium]|nr:hypothetical protein [Treponemataceae bacterium]
MRSFRHQNRFCQSQLFRIVILNSCKIAPGSSSFDLNNSVNEPLTGRKREIRLYPLSFGEMVEEHGLLTEKRMIPTRLVYGLYPEVVTNPGDKKTVLREIAESYLSRFQKSVTFEIGFWRKITSL